jgi:anti-sigma factor (TIGR02949 family)
MTCEDVRRFLELYIDGEFEGDECNSLENHLVGCEECRRLESGERSFRRAFRAKLPPVVAPTDVRDRIANEVTRLANERQRKGQDLAYQAAAFALAASLLLVLWWPFGSNPVVLESTVRSGPVATTVGGLIADASPAPVAPRVAANRYAVGAPSSSPLYTRAQLANYSRLPADVRGGTSDIQQYMQSRVPFVVSAPLQPGQGLRLVGARQILAAGQPAVLYIYEVAGERVNVVQTAMSEGGAKPQSLQLQREGTTTWGRFVREGVLHWIVSELEPHELSRLVGEYAVP